MRVRNSRTGRQEFARVKVPQMLPRFVRVDPDESIEDARYITLEDLIANHLGDLFPGMEIVEHHVFRVTRNEDVEIEEDETENLIKALEKELLRRRFGPPIRLEITDDMDDVTLGLLVRELDVTEQEVFRLPGAARPRRPLRPRRGSTGPSCTTPRTCRRPRCSCSPRESNLRADVFAAISRQDVLLHHPYESFATSVQAFLEQAAADPDVLAIKQTLYRTSGDSPIVEALIDAAESGKQVLALVEIKARFDEQANISWARKLEKAGVHVVYGLVGLKTHCKLALVIRQEKGGLRHYSHIGTGNYNPKTSRIYEDLGLLTADDQVGKDLTRLFNELSGYAIEKKFKRLLVAPLHLRKGLLKLIAGEVRNAEAGRPRGIRIKVNSIVDEAIIDALYRASNAGVPVEVWVRGICSLRPGIPGLSENIRVRSILGRYLEHSRIFSFQNDGDPQVYIGSADMMHRNLDRRVEALVRLTDPDHLAEIDALFDMAMDERTSSWWLDGERRVDPPLGRRRGTSARRHAVATHAADRTAHAARGSGVDDRGLRRRRRLLARHRRQGARAGGAPHRVRRRHDPQGQGRSGRVAAPHRRARDRRGDRPRGRARRAARRLAVPAAERAREDRALLGGRGERAGRAALDVQAERRDRRPRVGHDQARARLPQLRARRRDPRDASRSSSTRASRARSRCCSCATARPSPAAAGRARMPRGRSSSAACSRRPRSSTPLTAWAPKRIVSSPAVRCVTTVTPLAAATGITIKREEGISQDAWESGHDEVRRVVGKRVRAGKSAVICGHGPVLPEIMREIALATGDAARLLRRRMPRASSPARSASCTSRPRTPGRASSRSRRTRRGPEPVATRGRSARRTPSPRHRERQCSFTSRLPSWRKLVRRDH